ncbi:MAG: response regulator, partial [Desulfobacterales bacterium]|nr:response regulator [Desulfobacterales bacterium]
MASILIIDDNFEFCETLTALALRLGHVATYALSLNEGLKKVSLDFFDVVFLDVRLPDGNGLEALPHIQQTSSSPEIFIVTGLGDADGAELAINSGAWAYVQKPISMKNIAFQLERALQYREEKTKAKSPVLLRRKGIIGNSTALERSLT